MPLFPGRLGRQAFHALSGAGGGPPSVDMRRPASQDDMRNLLKELDVKSVGDVRFKLVSRWAAKHVWRADMDGVPFAYIRYLLGSAADYPDRWRHFQLSERLHEIKVGPRVLGLSAASEALQGRAAIVETAMKLVTREELEARAVEAVSLFTRLHSSSDLLEDLSTKATEQDIERLQPVEFLFQEIRERWFEALVARWLEVGLSQITPLSAITHELLNTVEARDCCPDQPALIVPAHNDPNHGNFMLNRQGALRLIDYEDLGMNNPVADLGVFLTWYVDKVAHREVLDYYPLAETDAILAWMQVWVPLRYLNIAAHWAARLTRATDEESYSFALNSIDEWLRGAAEIINEGPVPDHIDSQLTQVMASLEEAYPLSNSD